MQTEQSSEPRRCSERHSCSTRRTNSDRNKSVARSSPIFFFFVERSKSLSCLIKILIKYVWILFSNVSLSIEYYEFSMKIILVNLGCHTNFTRWNVIKNMPFDPAIPLLGIYLKGPKTLIQKNINIPMFIAAIFTIAKIWKQPKCPSVDEWIKQL